MLLIFPHKNTSFISNVPKGTFQKISQYLYIYFAFDNHISFYVFGVFLANKPLLDKP